MAREWGFEMKVWTLEVIKTYDVTTNDGHEVEVEERIVAGVYPSKADALFYWGVEFKGEWEDYDLTEWDI